MPQTTAERAARWPGMDGEATAYLKAQGYRLTKGWHWVPPTPDHEPTYKEADAILYLVQEWDFGGLRRVVRVDK